MSPFQVILYLKDFLSETFVPEGVVVNMTPFSNHGRLTKRLTFPKTLHIVFNHYANKNVFII